MSCYTSHEELIDGSVGYFWRFFGIPAVKLVSVRKHKCASNSHPQPEGQSAVVM